MLMEVIKNGYRFVLNLDRLTIKDLEVFMPFAIVNYRKRWIY